MHKHDAAHRFAAELLRLTVIASSEGHNSLAGAALVGVMHECLDAGRDDVIDFAIALAKSDRLKLAIRVAAEQASETVVLASGHLGARYRLFAFPAIAQLLEPVGSAILEAATASRIAELARSLQSCGVALLPRPFACDELHGAALSAIREIAVTMACGSLGHDALAETFPTDVRPAHRSRYFLRFIVGLARDRAALNDETAVHRIRHQLRNELAVALKELGLQAKVSVGGVSGGLHAAFYHAMWKVQTAQLNEIQSAVLRGKPTRVPTILFRPTGFRPATGEIALASQNGWIGPARLVQLRPGEVLSRSSARIQRAARFCSVAVIEPEAETRMTDWPSVTIPL